MPRKNPSYRFHKARNCAVVTINGRDHYLGVYDSPESWEAYHRLIAEHLAARREPPPPVPADTPLTVTELIARYWRFAKTYYVKDDKPTSEVYSVALALRFVRRLYGRTSAGEFSPKRLKAVREAMIAHEITRKVKVADEATGTVTWERRVVRKGLARKCINKLVGRVKRMFAWAVEEELLPVEVHAALVRVKGLKRGKSAARETPRVRPVAEEHVAAVLPLVPAMVRAMIEVQRLCGCRPQDVVQMRPAEIDTTEPVWQYRPRRHKTQHHNDDGNPDLDRVIYLGPKSQEVLRPWLPADPEAYVFAPRRSEELRNAGRKADRKSKVTPSQAARRPTGRAKAPLRSYYPVGSYRQAIRRACRRAGIAVWLPNQLRHSRLTEIRSRYGLEAARVVGGHREVGVTQIYAEQDRELARQVMGEVG
ncbi:catalytic phage domain protein : Site-specific recombinase XerD OS=Singulisphaera acidiphila (strain ATCC BAA-1392 / DSM 18658 / VKM B-2454 / MOB10) GN=Sinac_1635 PE=4 SV=1: Phage_integrase [Gemmataceae bacterium]|nr:catalytic phage domain protein : Site-specific recombinase XerD OS=Singulisphaera acidiphila (strain ATCC BAA-1392 / DSM 18658 / VKM B-2454 / MOB10) GN=Sinac_1635 PE=4 SV=1: Phage_integrase [Gemmataceae bacterium]VTT99512.1 catalytic phage domain protein : Site-specific recombinase XerD OS=Singulisphaera acidiphila (strain ATCC BAA-1392 / DSM 18658 / VKM B-2454 / MOB10) GN=Sinac_1635 PE=4 SV=1: Phage_integrase [Gemmataceae bacterium]